PRRPVAREALTEYAGLGTVLNVAVPRHHKVASAVARHCRPGLEAEGVGVDLELGTLRPPVACIALAEDAAGGPVLAVARPHHHEVAGALARHRRPILPVRGVGVDLELGPPRCPIARVALPEHAVRITVLDITRPHHHEVAGTVARHRRRLL